MKTLVESVIEDQLKSDKKALKICTDLMKPYYKGCTETAELLLDRIKEKDIESFTDEELILQDAILSARKIQKFLWG